MSAKLKGFRKASVKALNDHKLQDALGQARGGFVDKRQAAIDALPEFTQIKARAKAIRDHTLSNLAHYLEQFEQAVEASGGQLHWASTTQEANEIVLDICKQADAERITKGKSMISEEMQLNHALEAAGFEVMETDLGEYIIQLAKETPSHIIAPAVHKTKAEIEVLFDQFHQQDLPANRSREELVYEARLRLREAFLAADVGITGANFLIADTGSTVLVTNEGNGDLTASIPKIHIVTASIDKVIPKLEDLPTFLRLLGRSATGQEITTYTSLFTGPKHEDEFAGPEQFHVVLLDNGRSEVVGSKYQDVLRCIRCGACINHCAVYAKVGGHAYETVYPGPIGQALTPLLRSVESTPGTISACTMNGHCKQVCPMSIPLSDLIRQHRIDAFEQAKPSLTERAGLRFWQQLNAFPWLYSVFTRMGAGTINVLGKWPVLQKLTPFLGNWKTGRALMRASGKTFQQQVKRRRHYGQ